MTWLVLLYFCGFNKKNIKSGINCIVFIYFWKEHVSVFRDHQVKLINRISYEIQTRFFMASEIPPFKFLLKKLYIYSKRYNLCVQLLQCLIHYLTLRAKLMKTFRYTTVPLTVISGAPEGLWPLLYPGPLSAALPLWPCWSVHNKCWPQLHPENLPTGGLRFQLHSDCSPLCKDQVWKLSTGFYWVFKKL